MCNSNELHPQFAAKLGTKIGISKFHQLRSKCCITAGESDIHSVCVCTRHRNLKQVLATLDRQHVYHDMMQNVACSDTSKERVIHQCDNCPQVKALHEFSKEHSEADYDAEDQITFKNGCNPQTGLH